LELRDLDVEMVLTGFNPRELDDLLRDTAADEKADQAPPLPSGRLAARRPLVAGNHKLLVGDATSLPMLLTS